MTALVIVGVVMGVCAIVILTKAPEALAALAAAAIILGANYGLPFSDWNRRMSDSLILTKTDTGIRIENAPAPEHVVISRELWDQFPVLQPSVDFESGIEPPAVWVEVIEHADPDRENDGYMFHVDGENATVAYRVPVAPEADADVIGTLVSWGEK